MLARLNESAVTDLQYPTLIVNDTRMATIDPCAASFGSTTDNPTKNFKYDGKKDTIISLPSSEGRTTRMRDSDDPIPLEAFKFAELETSHKP